MIGFRGELAGLGGETVDASAGGAKHAYGKLADERQALGIGMDPAGEALLRLWTGEDQDTHANTHAMTDNNDFPHRCICLYVYEHKAYDWYCSSVQTFGSYLE